MIVNKSLLLLALGLAAAHASTSEAVEVPAPDDAWPDFDEATDEPSINDRRRSKSDRKRSPKWRKA